MMKLVCFDNNVLLWGIKEEATAGQEEMIPRTKQLLKQLADDHTSVLIPSLVIAEFLVRISPDMHTMIINLFNKGFIVAPFDTAAASMFARIWRKKKEDAVIEELTKNGKTKAELKVDSLIVATAVARKAECIYTHDDGMKAFAKGHIEALEIPFIPQQLHLKEQS